MKRILVALFLPPGHPPERSDDQVRKLRRLYVVLVAIVLVTGFSLLALGVSGAWLGFLVLPAFFVWNYVLYGMHEEATRAAGVVGESPRQDT